MIANGGPCNAETYMFNLFGTNMADDTEATEDENRERFSRFETASREDSPLRKLGKLTRFNTQHDVVRNYDIPTQPVTPRRPERLVPAMDPREPDTSSERLDGKSDSAHLHDDGRIPLWVIKKALPGRF